MDRSTTAGLPPLRLLTGPGPVLAPDVAARAAEELFGVTGTVRDLGSQQDLNLAVVGDAGRFVLKVAHEAWSVGELEAQNAALAHVAGSGCPVAVPGVRPARDGRTFADLQDDGTLHHVRLLTWLPGPSLTGRPYLAAACMAALGRLAGELDLALADFVHPDLDRALQWDLRYSGEVVDALAPYIGDTGRRDRLTKLCRQALGHVDPLAGRLRVQAVHGDVTDDNVVCTAGPDGRLMPHGVIDFGDLAHGWVVGDLAATCTSLLHHVMDEPVAVLPAVQAFHRVVPLGEDEAAALWPLMLLRAATLVVSGAQQAALDPANAYVREAADREWLMFERAAALPLPVAEEAVRRCLGLDPGPRARAARTAVASATPLLGADALCAGVEVLDLSVTGDALHDGDWLRADAVDRAAAVHRTAPAGASATRYGEHRLTATVACAAAPAATLALGVELRLPGGTALLAPLDSVVGAAPDGRLVLRADSVDVLLGGVEGGPAEGTRLLRGEPLGRVGGTGGSVLAVQACAVAGLAPPPLVTPVSGPAWQALCPDPSPLVGLALAAPAADPQALLARRDTSYATVQEHYYASPPQIERGWRHHLVDTTARTYLDVVNNVTVLGHAHPGFVRAVGRQWALLNTNSRFHYEAVAELPRRLAALLPEELDTVLLVNSGSEAVDLALRLAFAHTGRSDVVAVGEAYHGVTLASDAVSTSVADNPQALATRPAWVHVALAPNTYRGAHRGPDAGERYAEDVVAVLDRMQAQGRPVAAYVAEAFYGNAGGIALPDGYLALVYAEVRRRGGLCIADEVQVGLGRLGAHLWGFEQQGVVPDVVTLAKALGNGHPLGAVVTSRAVADSLAAQGSFFSSAGGSPVSCRAGLAVLDALRDEHLQDNAREVGDHLRARLDELAMRHPLVGAVHGMGLYLGVELVLDRDTLEPATDVARALCERMRELGVVVQPTADRVNVLKVKPPMCLDRAGADFFVDCLERALREGW